MDTKYGGPKYGKSLMASLYEAQRLLNAERARRLEAGEPLMTTAEIKDFLQRRRSRAE